MSTNRSRIAFKSLGCRVNFEELECLRGRFVDEGWTPVDFEEQAELYVINTCTVTGLADAESRKLVRRAVRSKPEDGLVVVTGCYAQRDPEALRALDGVDLVLGNSQKAALFEHVMRFREDRRLAGEIWVDEDATTRAFLPHGGAGGVLREGAMRTRATLKIQDGCNEACTYCIIPSVRGASVSRELDAICEEATRIAASGYRELALTGVNTGWWGRDFQGTREDVGEAGLARVVRSLEELGLGLRYRLNSLEPETVSDALLDALEDAPSFARHFHIPLQHGDSKILRRMGRGYDQGFYRETIARIHARFPHAGIGADIMVGFPSEDDAAFEASRRFVLELPLSYLHVFTYSQREGTAATRMSGHVDAATKKARSRRLHEAEDELRARFLARQRGRLEDVLVESKRGPSGGLTGLTGNYVRVELPADSPARENDWVRARIGEAQHPRLASATISGRRSGRPVA